MRSFTVSEIKATLSKQLASVRRGQEVIITNRGRAIAKIVPIRTKQSEDKLVELEARGHLRRGKGSLSKEFWQLKSPEDGEVGVRRAVDEERGEGW